MGKTQTNKEKTTESQPLYSIPLVEESIVARARYSGTLKAHAENFIAEAFEKGLTSSANNAGELEEDSFVHSNLLLNIAMYILNDASWIQPQNATVNLLADERTADMLTR